MLTLTLQPFVLVAVVAVAVAGSCVSPARLLPIVFALLALVLPDIATRDIRANTMASLYAAPRLREQFVWWKLGSSLLLALALCATPLARAAWLGALPLCALVTGLVFVAAAATSLGVVTQNSKTFIVLFLSFWYLAVNDRGVNRWFDFAGWNGRANLATIALYAGLSIFALVVTQTFYRMRLR